MTKARERAEQLRQELARPYEGENLLEVRHLKKYFRTGSRFLPGKQKPLHNAGRIIIMPAMQAFAIYSYPRILQVELKVLICISIQVILYHIRRREPGTAPIYAVKSVPKSVVDPCGGILIQTSVCFVKKIQP